MKKICPVCKKEFESYERSYPHGTRFKTKMRINAVTCSSKCSKKYRRFPYKFKNMDGYKRRFIDDNFLEDNYEMRWLRVRRARIALEEMFECGVFTEITYKKMLKDYAKKLEVRLV